MNAPLSQFDDLQSKTNFKLYYFAFGSLNTSVQKWRRELPSNEELYKKFLEPYQFGYDRLNETEHEIMPDLLKSAEVVVLTEFTEIMEIADKSIDF